MESMRTMKCWSAALLLGLLAACGGGGGGGGGNATSATNGGPVPDTLSGTVLYNGAPLAGVTVTAVNTNSNPSTVFGVTTSDASGNYSFANLPTGCNCVSNYQFWASKPGYSFAPTLAANPSNNRSGYSWDSAPQNWYTNTGAAVTRAGFNGEFSNPDGGPGLVFTVINFNALANNSMTGANFSAIDGRTPLVTLAATGQQTSYASGDDAALKKGAAWPATRFIDHQDGTVTDQLTGLTWLKNAGCLAPTTWAPAVAAARQLASGSCGLSDGSVAGQWRLPNVVELESVIDASASNPALTPGNPFTQVSNATYWTSTVYYGGQEGTSNAWAIRLADGRYMNDTTSNVIASSVNAVWAVKGTGGGAVKLQASGAYVPFASGDDGTVENGVALPQGRMVDNGNGTVTDTVTGLIWLKQASCIKQTWSAAVATVNNLASGQCGLTDGSAAGSWRMPNRKEMQSLADRAQNNMGDALNAAWTSKIASISSLPAAFASIAGFQYYWTSTTDAASNSEAWAVFSCDFGVYDIAKTSTAYTLALRSPAP